MRCERCGKEISDTAAICPSCGTLTESVRPVERPERFGRSGQQGQPPTQHGTYPSSAYDEPMSSYEQGYAPRQSTEYMPPPQSNYMPPRVPPQQPNYQYGPSYAPPFQQPGVINVSVYNNYSPPNAIPVQKKTNALVVEIILSLFGLFGVGWLMADETTTGVILLICSVSVYIPIILLGTLLTFGIGIVCTGPLSIAAIIVNAVLLNKRLNSKAAQQVIFVQTQQAQQMPPQYPRY